MPFCPRSVTNVVFLKVPFKNTFNIHKRTVTQMEFRCKDKNSLTELIEERVQRLGWNQATLARKAGISRAVVHRLTQGKNISLRNTSKILEALNLFQKEKRSDFTGITTLKKGIKKYPFINRCIKELAEALEKNRSPISLVRILLNDLSSEKEKLQDDLKKNNSNITNI